jgi:hypothetical protein
MSQVIRYRNRNKGVSVELGNPVPESHGLGINKKSYARLLMLTKWLGTPVGLLLTFMQPLEPKNNIES